MTEEQPQIAGENQEIQRNPDGTFPPGVSGNPSGKPKGTLAFKTEFELVLKEVAKQIKEKDGKTVTVDEVKRDMLLRAFLEAKKGNFNFYKDIIDRLYGKAPDVLEVEGGLFSADKVVITNFKEEQKRKQEEQEKLKGESPKAGIEREAGTSA